MFNTLRTILLGRQGRALQALETANAAVIIEQKLREAETAHGGAKRALASLIVKIETEDSALAMLNRRHADLLDRARRALDPGKDTLASDAATLIAQLENERTVREQTLASTRTKAERLRLHIERTQRQLVELRQGLITAQSVEKERRALAGSYSRDVTAQTAIREGEAVLKRLIASDDPIAIGDALEQIEDDLSGRATTERLADAGFGDPLRTRAQDVLERLRSETPSKPAKSKTAKA